MSYIIFSGYIYLFFQILLIIGLWRHKKGKPSNRQQFISIVIAAHNEAAKIKSCLDSLINQSYPNQKYEIILVDDRSRDETVAISEAILQRFTNHRIIQITKIPYDYSPKKYALQQGIEASLGDWILTVDADCIASPTWITEMVQYCDDKTGMVSGNVELTGKTLFQKILSFDHLFFTSSYAGTMGLHFPTYCSGGNRGFSKDVFKEVSGFRDISSIVSGDDDLLMHLIHKNTQKRIRFVATSAATVFTDAPASLSEFVKQRTRHISKTFYYPGWMLLGLLLLFIFNLTVIGGFLSMVITWNGSWLSFFKVKLAADFLLVLSGMWKLDNWKKIPVFPFWWVLHPFYVVGFGLWGQIGNIKWKDQNFERSP